MTSIDKLIFWTFREVLHETSMGGNDISLKSSHKNPCQISNSNKLQIFILPYTFPIFSTSKK